ncbi:maleylpyruvate isomerase family mycothiol-dependent enzyme [Nonomuraea sp. NPDC048826]|uniref:maleylpyruvate isomerase family mycothiol-dependent enzyme n=1 Tax=Nonomuraea sp. NPDC048826 TaxID=3364347 RepID=UPI0037117371
MTDYCSLVENETARVAELAGAPADTPVPACPGWTLGDLITHLGTMHRWVTHMVSTRNQDRLWSREVPNGLAEGAHGDAAWLVEGSAEMVRTLRATDPATPLWTWGPGGDAGWWARRMTFELVVHRVDAEQALGLEPQVDAAVATDGVDELLGNLSGAPWVRKRLAELGLEGATFHLHATDVPGEWTFVQGTGGAVTWERGHAKGDAAVRAPVRDLLLLMYGRCSLEGLTVFGDRALLERWLSASGL